ncbi:YwiC-like family protein [Conservatibacter flavescens]|uniref:YwiC-like family protein n=1 Tax=Conservatibacter flavescens TaxID=28161 RepID=A0A2M8S404_9PAST|nr:YwiC-like family protein [Conservatibacter flavescens]PJG85874.1 hypothetical protein CVP05_03840 [Conservatibacter flavescens]
MKLLISNQHGAIVMALMPFLYGMLSTTFVWQHIALLFAWFSLYLMTYPFFNLFKGRNLALYQKWTWIYGVAAFVFSLPALFYNWTILYFLVAMLPFALMHIYYTKKKNERALLNDFAAIAIFSLAGMAAYYFSAQRFDQQIWLVAIYPALFFIGTTLYVKSVLRERKNKWYLRISLIFHLTCVIVLVAISQYGLAATFFPALLRAFFIPQQKLSAKQIGFIEIGISLLFFIMLVYFSV